MLFNFANLPYWIFLGIGIILFLLVIFSGGVDSDVDSDMDIDVNLSHSGLDIETDSHIESDSVGDFDSGNLLTWFGVGKAPLILLLAIDFSLWGLTGWIFNIFIASFTGTIPHQFFGWGGIVLIFSFILSLVLGSFISRPLGQIFAGFGEDVSSDRLIGCVGVVNSKIIPYQNDGKIGQADVLDAARNLVTVNVVLPDWAIQIPQRGEQILIIEHQQELYFAIVKDSRDEEQWIHNYHR